MEILNSKDIHKQALAKIRIKYLKKQKLTINKEIKKSLGGSACLKSLTNLVTLAPLIGDLSFNAPSI